MKRTTGRLESANTCRRRRGAGPVSAERLEGRTLMALLVVNPIVNQVFEQDSGTEQANLYGVFSDHTGVPDLAFTATSDNPRAVSVSVSGSALSLTPVAGASGFAHVQMSATDPLGNRVLNTFRVQITPAAGRALDVTLGGKLRSVSFRDANGASATIALSGPGTAVAHFGGDGLALAGDALHGANQELEGVTLAGTTGASRLVITGRRARGIEPVVGHITVPDSLGQLSVKTAQLAGDVTVTGSLPRLDADFADGGAIKIGSGPVAITGGTFVDESFTSDSPVTRLQLVQWADSDKLPETFSAAYVRSLKVRGDFSPGLQLSGNGATGRTLDHVTIPGNIGGVWNVAGASAPLSVGSTLSGWNAAFGALPSFSTRGDMVGILTAPTIESVRIRGMMLNAMVKLTAAGTTDVRTFSAGSIAFGDIMAAGNIGSIVTSRLESSQIYAGLDAAPFTNVLPAAASDFANSASIGSIVIKPTAKFPGFKNTFVAATTLGSLQLGTVATDNAGVPFGVVGSTIASLSALLLPGGQRVSLSAVNDAATLDSQLAAQNASPGDLVLRIV